jgi:hypothetical protein
MLGFVVQVIILSVHTWFSVDPKMFLLLTFTEYLVFISPQYPCACAFNNMLPVVLIFGIRVLKGP